MNKLKSFENLKSQFISKAKSVNIYSVKEIISNTNKIKNQQFQNIKKNLAAINLTHLNPKYSIQYLQDKVITLVSSSDPNEVVLKQSGFWAQAITWVLMGGTAFSIGWLAIAKTDEVVIALGRLEPKSGVVDVQMPLQGIAREILISEGDQVKKGQVLIRLDAEITEAKNQALQKTLELETTILNSLRELVTEGAVSELQYLQQQAKIEDLKSQIKTNLVMMRYQEIISPVSGIVFELQPKGPGYVAQTSQPVMKIVPFDNLLARVEIDNRTIGFVKKGKHADISIDSFPSSDFGVIKGTVTKIGSDALAPIPAEGKGYRFPADITLDNQYLKIKSGKKLPLQAGMSLTANIKLRKVTYLQLLFTKFSKKADSLKSI
tara:strand:- start:195 stop:1325 length:1131 start_codon:yes stop_codon:yes gene_type:complete